MTMERRDFMNRIQLRKECQINVIGLSDFFTAFAVLDVKTKDQSIEEKLA